MVLIYLRCVVCFLHFFSLLGYFFVRFSNTVSFIQRGGSNLFTANYWSVWMIFLIRTDSDKHPYLDWPLGCQMFPLFMRGLRMSVGTSTSLTLVVAAQRPEPGLTGGFVLQNHLFSTYVGIPGSYQRGGKVPMVLLSTPIILCLWGNSSKYKKENYNHCIAST